MCGEPCSKPGPPCCRCLGGGRGAAAGDGAGMGSASTDPSDVGGIAGEDRPCSAARGRMSAVLLPILLPIAQGTRPVPYLSMGPA